jgi:hypothetical protein
MFNGSLAAFVPVFLAATVLFVEGCGSTAPVGPRAKADPGAAPSEARTESSLRTYGIQLEILSLDLRKKGPIASVRVTNRTGGFHRISLYSISSAVLGTTFSDGVASLHFCRTLAQVCPAPLESDFSLRLEPGESRNVPMPLGFVSDGLCNDDENHYRGRAATLKFKVSGSARVADAKLESVGTCAASGAGDVPVSWEPD